MRDIVDHRYRVEEQLAVGGFGTIYRATDTAIDRQVALKILHRELAGDPHVVGRFRRETAALAKLRSPHTLTIFDVGEHDDTLYFVMELLRGESLHEVFARTGPLAWRRLAHIMRGICSSLREAHALGIVHRDLKPANIFLVRHNDDADYVKVVDFGIAKAVASDALDNRDLTRHGQMIGTFDYMAPEQMVGAPCTNKSDIFTLGIVMYEMLTGARPFGAAQGPAQMLMALMTVTPAPLTGVPSELARIVMRCIAREPQERPDIEQLDRVLERVLAVDAFGDCDEPTLIAPQAPRPSSPRRVTQQRGSAQAAAMSGSILSATPHTQMIAGASLGLAPTLDVRPSTLPTVMARGSDVEIPPFVEGTPAHGSHADIAVRCSEAAIARDIELALAETLASDTPSPLLAADVRAAAAAAASVERIERPVEIGVRFVPTPAAPVAAPKRRMAAGTSPVANDDRNGDVHAAPLRAVTLPPAPESSSLVFARYLTIALCLFGLGFLGALVVWSL